MDTISVKDALGNPHNMAGILDGAGQFAQAHTYLSDGTILTITSITDASTADPADRLITGVPGTGKKCILLDVQLYQECTAINGFVDGEFIFINFTNGLGGGTNLLQRVWWPTSRGSAVNVRGLRQPKRKWLIAHQTTAQGIGVHIHAVTADPQPDWNATIWARWREG